MEGVCKCEGNPDGTVGVVALPDVQKARDAADRAEVEIIEAVLAAGKRQNDRVLRRFFYKLGIIISARARAVAAADQEEVADGTGFDRVNHLRRNRKNRICRKAGRDRCAAVDAGEALVFRIAAEADGMLDERGEIFVLPDVLHAGVAHDGGRVDAVCVAVLRRHETVRGEKHRRGDILEFFLLALPGGAEVALELRVLFELRVAVRRQHLAMRVDVDALAVGLFEQQLQIAQIVTGDDDERTFFNRQRHLRRHGIAERFGVCPVQQRHARKILFTDLQHERQKLFHAPVFADGKQRLGKKAAEGFVLIAQHIGVVGVRCHAAHAEENERLEAADVLLRGPELSHVVVVVVPAGILAAAAVRDQTACFFVDAAGEGFDVFGAEIDVGERGKQGADHQMPGVLRGLGVRCGSRQPNERAGEHIL